MLLPSIFGSTILLIFGLYTPIFNSINKVIKFNFEYLPAIIIFGIDVLLGILLTVKVVKYLLKNIDGELIIGPAPL